MVVFGSTHNVIDINKAKQINLFVFPAKGLKASTITDQHIEEVGKCHKVALQIQNLNLQLDCYALPHKEVDLILGADWLTSLGTYSTNLQKQYMEFRWKGTKHRLHGSKGSIPKQKESQHEKDPDHHQIKEVRPEHTYHINICKDPE